jgi:hypothetical protein
VWGAACPILEPSYRCSPPHLTLAAPSAVSTGDPTKVSLASSWLMVMNHEELVLGELAQDTLKEGPVWM